MIAAESGHWYDADGNPAYTLTGKNGVERNTTLRDARKLNLFPSVTTILKEGAAPGLERWKQEQVLHAALTLPRGTEENGWGADESEADWIRRVWDDSREQARLAAERGTEIHAAIERHYLYADAPTDLMPWVDAAVESIGSLISREAVWSAEKSFVSPRGYGGKVDLNSEDCHGIVADIKTKDGPLDGLKLYDNHFMQLAAYGDGLGFDAPMAYIVFVRRDEPEATVKSVSRAEYMRGLNMFDALLTYWQAKTGYTPRYGDEETTGPGSTPDADNPV